MPYKASHRYARVSARKVRPLADLIRGKYADEALDVLRYQHQLGARLLEKVLRSAMANAEDQNERDPDSLIIIDARIDGGPMFKRLRPRARGMAFTVKRRMSHIHIALETREAILAATRADRITVLREEPETAAVAEAAATANTAAPAEAKQEEAPQTTEEQPSGEQKPDEEQKSDT